MEVFRTISGLVLLLVGLFWEEGVDMLNNTLKKNNKKDKMKVLNSTSPTCDIIATKDDDDVTADHDSTSVITWDHIRKLDDDVMMNILSRLPATTLMKYKSFSKAWRLRIIEVCNYLIPQHGYPMSGLIFCKQGFIGPTNTFYRHCPPLPSHLHDPCLLNDNKNHLIAEDSNQTVAKSFTSLLPMMSKFHNKRELLDCCNGLLLFRDSYSLGGSNPLYMVCNPTTQECMEVPGKIFMAGSHDVALAFDPSESLHYKIILTPGTCKRKNLWWQRKKLIMFSSETNSWTKLKLHLKKSILIAPWFQSAYFSGTLYKLSMSGQLLKIFINRKVSKFNRIQYIDLPLARYASVGTSECIGLQNGCLHYAVFDNDGQLRIFTLENTSGNDFPNKKDFYWCLNHSISSYSPYGSNYHFILSYIYSFHPHLDIVVLGYGKPMDGIFESENVNIVFYNYKINKIQGQTTLHYKFVLRRNFSVFPFTRCFLPLVTDGGIDYIHAFTRNSLNL